MTFGITAAGFVRKRLEDSKASLEAALEAQFGPINKDPDGPFGQFIGVYAKAEADIWEVLEAIYYSSYRSTASDTPLDNVGDIIAVPRLSATKSVVIASATGTQGTVLPIGRIVSVDETGNQFTSTEEVTIDKAAASSLTISVATVIDSTDYTTTVNGNIYIFNSGAGATAISIAAGLVAAIILGSDPVTVTDNLDGSYIIDTNDLDVTFSGLVDANQTIDATTSPLGIEAVETGPVVALTGTLVNIDTPISGWDSVTNLNDATIGRDQESDSDYRIRQLSALATAGAGTVPAIRSKLLTVDDVVGVAILENTTMSTVGSLPAKSFNAIVGGGTDQDIGDAIWEVKPAGIESFGTTSVVVIDSQGNSQTVYFSRATEIYLWVDVVLTFNTEETFPVDGLQAVADAVLAEGQLLNAGEDVIVQKFVGPIFGVPGIATATVTIATSATPSGPPGGYSGSNLAMAADEAASFDSARITVA